MLIFSLRILSKNIQIKGQYENLDSTKDLISIFSFRKLRILDILAITDNFLPALENITSSQIVADNLNALHSARENFIKSEASSKLKLALKHQTRTSGDVLYNTGDVVFYKRK